jgi:hypothetical protein
MARLFNVIRKASDDGLEPTSQPNAAAWVSWDLGLSPATGRRWVRVAQALGNFAVLEESFVAGEISLDQIDVLLRVADSHTEQELVELARHHDVSELKQHVRALLDEEKADRANATDQDESWPHLYTWWIDDVMHLKGSIPGADGVVVETALMRLAAKSPKDPASGLYRNHDERMSEALTQMASESLAEDRDHDRATIVVHIPAAEVASESGAGWDAARRFFGSAELKRLLCDARVQPAIHDPAGLTVGVGRMTRRIDPWLRRLVEERDGTCRFPGCDRSRWTQVHHQQQWVRDQGPTNLDNLLLLCGFHHRLIHREGWEIRGDPNSNIVFLNKFGNIHRPARTKFGPEMDDFHLNRVDSYFKRKLAEVAPATPP